MAQKEFLQGEIAEQFLANATEQPLQDKGEALAFMTPTVIASIIFCPSVVALSIAFCTR